MLASSAVAGCSRGPAAPTVVLTSLAIVPEGGLAMLLGTTATITTSGELLPDPSTSFGAFAHFSSGGRLVEAAWTSSNSAVISVDGRQAVARATGTATLTATYQGRSASAEFRVERGMAGPWAGSALVRSCDSSSPAVREAVCNPAGNARPRGLAPVGETLPISLEVSETGSDLAAVASFGFVGGALVGTRVGRNVQLEGTIESGGWAFYALLSGNIVRDDVEGEFLYQVRVPNLPGFAMLSGRLTLTAQ